MEFTVIACVDIANVEQSITKISLGKDISRKRKDDSGGLLRRSTVCELC